MVAAVTPHNSDHLGLPRSGDQPNPPDYLTLDDVRGGIARMKREIEQNGSPYGVNFAYDMATIMSIAELWLEQNEETYDVEGDAEDELARLSAAARPGPWQVYNTVQADTFIVEESQGLLRGPGPVMGPSYDKSTAEYIVALVNSHRAELAAGQEGA